MRTVLLYGDTLRYPAVRHEVPLEVVDPLLFVAHDGGSFVMTSALERARIARALPSAQVLTLDELGFFELVESGIEYREAELETVVRALRAWGIENAVVPGDLPVAVADRLRGAGIGITVDSRAVDDRRRVKTPAELDGIRRAQRAAEAGMAVAEQLIRGADRDGGLLHRDGEPLMAEAVRAAIRSACSAAGAPAPRDIMVASAFSDGGHDPGSGPLPADLPITVDLWPRDDDSGCWADMTRTFVAGSVSEQVAALGDVVREALEAVRRAARPGVSGRALHGIAAEVVERAGYPTQRTRSAGETLTEGFYFSLGHGVGLEEHEAPWLGLASDETLVAGDVVAVEPGIEGLEGIGGVRFEDLLLITDDGCETLTQYPYDL
jgi:Xaa-Pro aminopeptidase